MSVISIILPTFNAANTIAKALDSVIEQTFANYEVLIIDGGSNDSTAEIVRSYAARNTRLKWTSEPDEGIYDAMNKGIQKASGEWIYFLGSDDYLYNDKVFEEVTKHLSVGLKIVYGNVLMGNSNSIYCGEINSVEILHWNICHQSIFYHRSCFDRKEYNKKFKILADYAFNIDIFCLYPKLVKHIDLIIAYYSNVGQSSHIKDGFDDTLPALRKKKFKLLPLKLKILYLLYNTQQKLPPSKVRGILLRVYKILK
jgi:glycosyltransferase involved in cell wall biosynthesis